MNKPPVREEAIQQSIIELLRVFKYHVDQTTVRGWRSGGKGYGASKGIPDLLIGRQEWGPIRLAMEVKGPTTKLSPEQQALLDRGLIVVVRSIEDALREIDWFEHARGYPEVAKKIERSIK